MSGYRKMKLHKRVKRKNTPGSEVDTDTEAPDVQVTVEERKPEKTTNFVYKVRRVCSNCSNIHGFLALFFLMGFLTLLTIQLKYGSDIDDCGPNKCQNNESCVDIQNDYLCKCPRSYCERAIDVSVILRAFPSISFITGSSHKSWPEARGLGAFEFNGNVHVWGGKGENGSSSKYIRSFDPSTETWAGNETTGDDPGRRSGFASTFVDGNFYVMGGDGGLGSKKDTFAYNPLTNTWKRLEDMPEERSMSCSWSYGNDAYVYGGRGIIKNHEDVLRFKVSNNKWSRILTGGSVPSARFQMSCSRLGDILFMHGGKFRKELTVLHFLDLKTWEWQNMTVPKFRPWVENSMSIDFVSSRLLLFVLEEEYQLFDIVTKSIVKSGSLEDSVVGNANVIIGNKLYLLGGHKNKHVYEFTISPK